MTKISFPNNLDSLYTQERLLRDKAIEIIQIKPKLSLHLHAIERAMSLAKIVVDCPEDDEDFKVVKMLSIRMFNAFGASLTLIFSGYHQNSAMVTRDILETVFLMDLFKTDHTAIERWRFADKKTRQKKFSPLAVRKTLDERDGFHDKKRAEAYKMLSELAAHPNMHSQHMLRPKKDGDIVTGPFMEEITLEAGVSELGRIAIQAGEIMNDFLPEGWDLDDVRASFMLTKNEWIETFYK
ncbi:MAG: hypothetical protein OEX19_02985 [Gammaproteobacteria bacterium]|nr:hypothetical protein [Gammaproteobacteria bacterium]